ncbi:alpha/beta-type small acid-soluble spore protein [Halalkalibacterium halodurans]|uniref:Small acid soluble protein n=2 Tax=Halalkalibacterium halodurans TaxID=86665 RepID=Q9KBL1_HALH5|nr:alpha/beta-type small acid-soluble spore protein [Halalkalibacterium halodurans]MDY7222477.1 alpha/beta-type small acid-soluble spore protein [Halalkalibacterium halodurans]MDY7241698.1 alpha/beta-type small acid-soluble spore protein [Halalkalibacterium halodurans]MED3648825.1 alpha/beta-type small acid-soluble spore protein [Halalkalibacterium halodurans]MED4082677.1 alpha/beta-type small acid-soluble spore protein [Halalkalibacterium halodurans]MED4085877.1 alpha/beta-type small acid-sol
MARRRRPLVPEAREALNQLKQDVMATQGYQTSNDVKYEVARELGVPLTKGYNGKLSSNEAGKVGGRIGGQMVKEMISMALQQQAKGGSDHEKT